VLTKDWKPLENIWASLDLDHFNWSYRNFLSQNTDHNKKSEESTGSQTNFCSRKTPQSKPITPKPIIPTNHKQPLKFLDQALFPILWLCYKGGAWSSGIVTLTPLKLLPELVHSLKIQLNSSNYRLTSGSWEISCNKLESPTHCFLQLDPLGLWMSQHKLRTSNFI